MASCSGSRKKDAVLNIEDLMDAITPYRTITEVDTLKQLVREIVSIPDITPIQADKIIHDKICEFKQKKLGIDSTQINNINLLH